VTSSRSLATWFVLAVAGAVAALGVTWAAETSPPRLERTSSAVLFDDVHLTPGVPVQRCAGIVPRGAGLVGLGLDGEAVGSLGPAVRIRVERGAAGQAVPADCSGFVPEATIHDGTLNALPPATAPVTAAVAIAPDRPVAYRATLTLPSAAAGETAFGLRITGQFADPPARRVVDPPPPEDPPSPGSSPIPGVPPPPPTTTVTPPPPPPCVQLQTDQRIQRASRDGAVRVVVRTPQALPIQLVRPLPIYVTVRDGIRPRVTAGAYRVPLRQTPGERWVGHVPMSALRRTPTVRITAGDDRLTVPVRTGRCAARVRSFLRADGTVDLRVDTPQALAGLRVRIPAALGRPSGGRLHVGAIDDRGRTRSSRGPVGATGRKPTTRLPRVTIAGRTVEILDVPRGVRTLSLRLAVPHDERTRDEVCPADYPTVGYVTVHGPNGTERDRVRSDLRLIGNRCPEDPETGDGDRARRRNAS